jgi:hypothetical protein
MNRALQWIYNYNLGSKFLTQCILFISLCLVISYILPWPCFPSFPSTPCGCTAQCAFPIKKLVIQHFTYLSSHLFYIHMLTSLMGFFHIYSWYLQHLAQCLTMKGLWIKELMKPGTISWLLLLLFTNWCNL